MQNPAIQIREPKPLAPFQPSGDEISPGEIPGPENRAPENPAETPAEEIPAEVVIRLQNGDINALEQVFRVYGDRVFNICRRITGSLQDAEDAAQEVFIRLLQQAGKFSGECLFRTWLFRLTINHTINLSRLNRRRRHSRIDHVDPRDLPEDGQQPPLENILRREERQHLDEALQQLPTDHRTILILREIEGLSYAEIAEVLDLPTGTVTSRLVRGRERLMAILRRYLPHENF